MWVKKKLEEALFSKSLGFSCLLLQRQLFHNIFRRFLSLSVWLHLYFVSLSRRIGRPLIVQCSLSLPLFRQMENKNLMPFSCHLCRCFFPIHSRMHVGVPGIMTNSRIYTHFDLGSCHSNSSQMGNNLRWWPLFFFPLHLLVVRCSWGPRKREDRESDKQEAKKTRLQHIVSHSSFHCKRGERRMHETFAKHGFIWIKRHC